MEGDKVKIASIEEINTFWNNFAPAYSKFDSTTQTFYYTLIHMLDLPTASHILEIACGTGKLLPLAINLKKKETTYLATDLTRAMIDHANDRLQQYIEKAGVSTPFKEWISSHNLTLKVANGEETIES